MVLVLTAVALVTVITDVLVRFGQFTVIYPLLFLIVALFLPRQAIWRCAIVLVVLIYVGFLLRLVLVPSTVPIPTAGFRFLNRSMVAVIIVALVPVVMPWRPSREDGSDTSGDAGIGRDGLVSARMDGGDEVDRLVALVWPMLIGCLAILFSVVVAVTDFNTPAQFNISVLYALPLLIASWTRRPAVIWSAASIFMLALLLAYYFGKSVSFENESLAIYIGRSRWLTAGVLVVLAAILHRWVSRRQFKSVPLTSAESFGRHQPA